MKILDQAKNGQICNAIKTYDELTDEEKKNLQLSTNEDIEDYATFQVRYNKKGSLLGVQGHEFSEKENSKFEKPQIDMVDSMQLLFGKKRSRAYEMAKKRITKISHVSDSDIDAARRLVNKKDR